MRDILKEIAWKIYFWLYAFYGRMILKCRNKHMVAVSLKAYIHTFSLFPNNTIKENREIAWAAQCELFELTVPEHDIDEGQVKSLVESLRVDDSIKNIMARYFILEAFYYSFGMSADLLREKAESAIKKAEVYVGEVEPIDYKGFSRINGSIKSDLRGLMKEIRELNSKKIENERLKKITPVPITSSHVAFVVSLFSTLFVLSGFVYNVVLFGSFGISVGDFFLVSDYLATSVDIISVTALSTAMGMAFFFLGMSDMRANELRLEQFGPENKSFDYGVAIIVVSLSIMLVIGSYLTGELLGGLLYPLLFFIVLHFVARLPVWDYVENRSSVGAVLVTLIMFSLHLGLNIRDEIKEIKCGEYKNQYQIRYTDNHIEDVNSRFVSLNANYLFLWSEDKQVMHVIPKTEMVGVYVKNK